MEKYEIVFSAELEADVNEFVRKWNADAECSKLAIAVAEKKAEVKQFNPLLNDMIVYLSMHPIEVGVGVATGLAANVIYDSIKVVFKRIGYSVSVDGEKKKGKDDKINRVRVKKSSKKK